MKMPRLPRVLILSLSLIILTILSLRLSDNYEKNEQCCALAPLQNVLASITEAIGLREFHSQVGQDRWIVMNAFPGVRDGYFVDVGSADGVRDSNTKSLEDIGWKGICIDPYPTNMKGRQCALFEEVVSSASGQTVQFRKAGFLGGIDNKLGRWKDAERVRNSPVVTWTTTTLNEILTRANAPEFIHYMSIDIEGGELEALKGLDFSKYRIGAITIEHNREEPKRSEIKAMLESKGYHYARSIAQDDCYTLAEPPVPNSRQ